MREMFYGCASLTSLDLSSFNTSSLLYTGGYYCGMFQGCSSLETIFVGNDWDMSDVTYSDKMFFGCTSLVGGNGTVYDSTHTDKTYARIDGDGGPGYLTRKV